MAGEGKLIIKSRAGVTRAVLLGDATGVERGGWWTLGMTQRELEPGQLLWSGHGLSPVLDELENFGQLEYWRRDRALGVPWYREFHGFHRDIEQGGNPGLPFIAGGVGTRDLLRWRHANYRTNVANRTAFVNLPAETIAKRLILYNLTAAGTTFDGRLRPATTGGLVNGFEVTIEDDLERGNVLTAFDCAQANILTALQRLCLIGGIAFDLVPIGPTEFEFRVYEGQRGTDRTSQVTFSTSYDNMVAPTYRLARADEVTALVVGGKGQGNDRVFVDVEGSAYDASENDIEGFLSYTNASDEDVLEAAGQVRLEQLRARPVVDFGVRQAGKVYGLDYLRGDLVRSQFLGIENTHLVKGTTITYEKQGAERIDVELQTL